MKPLLFALTVAAVRWWTRFYTLGMPGVLRERRRREIASDLWELREDPDAGCGLRATMHLLVRLAMGVPDDLGWRLEQASIDSTAPRRTIALAATGGGALVFLVAAFMISADTTRKPADLSPSSQPDTSTGADQGIEQLLDPDVPDSLRQLRAGILAVTSPATFSALYDVPLHAQAAASPPSTPGPEPLTVEITSIKRNTSGRPGPLFQPLSGGFSARGITVQLLAQTAYGVQHFQIAGGPGWITADQFDVAVKLEGITGPMRPGQLSAALQTVLADRFALKVHHETREGQIYELVASDDGPRLTPATGLRPASIGGGGYVSGTFDLTALCNVLAWRLERPVVNRTGLSGAYDIELLWTPDSTQLSGNNLPPPPPPAPPPLPPPPGRAGVLLPMRTPPALDPSGPSIFTAIQEQLGLKLNSARGPIDVLVIDAVEKPMDD